MLTGMSQAGNFAEGRGAFRIGHREAVSRSIVGVENYHGLLSSVGADQALAVLGCQLHGYGFI